MMPPLNLPFYVFDRPFKPVSLGFVIVTFVFMATGFMDQDILHASPLGDVVVVMAGIAFVGLIVGWWTQSQRIAEVSLLLVMACYVARGSFQVLSYGITSETALGIGLSLAGAVIAGGSFLLERSDAYQRGR